METRKVQVTGKSTYVVSLPKKWVSSVQLKSGDSIAMIPLPDGTMLINPKLKQTDREFSKKVINVDSNDTEQLFRKFIGAYLAGYNVIELRTMNNTANREIRKKIHELSYFVIGPQIIEETSNSTTLRDLLDSSDFSLLKGIKRMYMIAKDMHLDAIGVLKTHNVAVADDVRHRDEEVDKLYWMIAKQYNLIIRDVFFADKIGIQPLEAQGYLMVAKSLERIADHAAKLSVNVTKLSNEEPIVQKVISLDSEVVKLLDEAMNAFYQNKFESADRVIDRAKMMSQTIDVLKQEILSMSGSASNIVPLAFIIDSLERTRAYAEDIAEIAINHLYITDYLSSTKPISSDV